MKKSLNYSRKLQEVAARNIFGRIEEDRKAEKANVYLFGPAGMIVLR